MISFNKDNLRASEANTLERMNRVLDFMESHLDQAIGLEDLARVACLSPYHFSRVFQKNSQELSQ